MTNEPSLFDQPQFPVLPYAGTSGHSGSDSSEERARREDRDGTTKYRQSSTLNFLRWRNVRGSTWKELADHFNWHHGQSSGVLSTLPKAGLIARLDERRDRCAIYVLPECVGDRPVDEYRKNITRTEMREHLATIEEMLDEGRYWEASEYVGALRVELG